MPRTLTLVLLGFLALTGLPAQPQGAPVPAWKASNFPSAVVPGQPFEIDFEITLPPNFYQDAGSPFLNLEPVGPFLVVGRGTSAPVIEDGKAVFTGTFVLRRTLVLPKGIHDMPGSIRWNTGWQICRTGDVCLLPGTGTLTTPLVGPVGQGLGFWEALFGAFLGGLILNLMPCVFPVLALKGLGLASTLGMTRSSRRKDALAFAAGGFGALTLLGLVTALVAALGQRLDWGFTFQQPVFVLILALVFWAFALQLWGVWTWSGSPFTLSNAVRPTPARAFVGGAFLVVAAAPCTAPFLGAALGFAFAQPPLTIPLFFSAAGFGLVLPLLVLQLLPGWARILPRPGPWMVVAERIAGTALGATVVYLLWIFTRQTAPHLGWPLVGLFLLVSAALILGRRFGTSWVARGTAAVLLAAALEGTVLLLHPGLPSRNTASSLPVSRGASPDWKEFSAQGLNSELAEGNTVLIDATADWCATCQVNEWTILGRPEVQKIMDRLRLVRIRADYTLPDPEIREWLASVGRAGLPVYALYRPGKPVYFFPELLTDGNFTDKLPSLLSP